MNGGFEMPHQTSKRKKQGFGGGKAKKPAQQGKTLTTGEAVARHMLLEYNAIKAEGGKVARVHARLKDTDEWFPVGNVSYGTSNNRQHFSFCFFLESHFVNARVASQVSGRPRGWFSVTRVQGSALRGTILSTTASGVKSSGKYL